MSQSSLENFEAHQKAMELFDLVVQDMAEMRKDPRCYRLVAQQVASADSICANIEAGHGRVSRAEYVRFLDFASGSVRETRGRHERMKHWPANDIVQHRTNLAGETIAILTKTIETPRRDLQKPSGSVSYLKDELTACDVNPNVFLSTPDPRP